MSGTPTLQAKLSKPPTMAKGGLIQSCFLVQDFESSLELGNSKLSFAITNQLVLGKAMKYRLAKWKCDVKNLTYLGNNYRIGVLIDLLQVVKHGIP